MACCCAIMESIVNWSEEGSTVSLDCASRSFKDRSNKMDHPPSKIDSPFCVDGCVVLLMIQVEVVLYKSLGQECVGGSSSSYG